MGGRDAALLAPGDGTTSTSASFGLGKTSASGLLGPSNSEHPHVSWVAQAGVQSSSDVGSKEKANLTSPPPGDQIRKSSAG